MRAAGIASLAVSLSVGVAAPAFAAPGFKFTRIAGDDRYETAAEAADVYGAAPDAIIANGQPGEFADALAGNYLAGVKDAPILLTRRGGLPGATLAQLEQQNAQNVWVLGGTAAVPQEQVEQLEGEGYTVTRIAGANRYETNAKIIAEGGDATDGLGLIATGRNFPDALAAGPFAYQGYSLGLVQTDSVPDVVGDALEADNVTKVLIFGGTGAVGAGVVSDLAARGITVEERFAGSDRSETSELAAEWALENLDFTDEHVGVASGYTDGFGADALAGGPVEGNENSPMLITRNVDNPDDVIDYLEAHSNSLGDGHIYGGSAAISDAAEAAMEAAAQGEGNENFQASPASNETSSDGVGDTQTITFSGIDADTIDLRYTNCDQVTVGSDGVVSFDDNDGNANQADLAPATSGDIKSVDGVAGSYGDAVNNVVVGDDGSVTVEVSRDAAGCARLVAFDGATNNVLDLDANNQPTEDFAVSGRILATDPDGVDATPETSTNRYGETHTVTAQLVDGSEPAAESGIAVRFSRYAGDCDPSSDAQPAGTPVEVQNATTDANGKATYSFTAADPNPAADSADTSFCIFVQVDLDGNGSFDDADLVQKTFSDDAAVAETLTLTPESDVNLVGSQHTVTATVTDQFGDPVVGQEVDFAVDTNSTTFVAADLSGTRTTNANGVATFTYPGPEDTASTDHRDDVIRATADDNNVATVSDPSDDAAKEWSEGVATVEGATDAEDQKFGTLQEAIDAAEAGDTITAEGEFAEDVDVDKALTLNGGGSDLLGQFNVISDNVTINGFDIKSDTVGIEVFTGGYTGLTFSNNTITGPAADTLDTGIFFNELSGGTVSGNTITDAASGVATDTNETVTISSNTFQNNEEGVGVGGVNVGISGNTFTTNDATDIYVKAYVPVSDAYLNQIAANNTFTPAAEVDYANDEVEPVGP